MSTRVYLGNVSFHATNQGLAEELAELGHPATRVEVVVDRETGRGRGFAFVEYENDVAAHGAISFLDGCLVTGRNVRAAIATPLRKSGGGNGNKRPRDGNRGRSEKDRGWDEEPRRDRRSKGRGW